jgi:hypothetical protein
MLQQVIEQSFGYLKTQHPNAAKAIFGKIWAVLASKRVRFLDGEIFMSWRPLSAELATIYNSWYGTKFTTDAFLKAFNPDTKMGADKEFDEVVMCLIKTPRCMGVFNVRMGPMLSAKTELIAFSETNILTGEEAYYTQNFKNGRACGQPSRISITEFERVCYSARD